MWIKVLGKLTPIILKITLHKEITKFWNRLTKVKQNNVKIRLAEMG